MLFPKDHYDTETIRLMWQAFDAAWEEVGFKEYETVATQRSMALAIMAAVRAAERNPERLKVIALRAILGPDR
jgi:hypothetical protein